ncbi:uncharacterized protein M6D78_016766 [Vipera latastei]
MREVQNYVDHVWALTEAQDALVAEYKQENEELRRKFAQLQLELDSQHKEVAELLALEGLTGIVHSSPSEQVAYLLVERSALLERMAALEEELGAPLLCLGRPCAAALQPPLEEPEGKNLAWEEAERAAGGAPDRLCSAQHVIPALNEDLDVSEGEPGELREAVGKGDQEAERAEQPVEPLAKPSLARVPDPDSLTASEWRKARGQKLPTDMLLLLEALSFPEAERQACLGGSGSGGEAASDFGGCFKDELKSLGFPERPLQRKLLPFPGFSVPLKSSKSRCFPETRPTSARMSPASPPAEAQVGEPKAPAGTSCLLGGGEGAFFKTTDQSTFSDTPIA